MIWDAWHPWRISCSSCANSWGHLARVDPHPFWLEAPWCLCVSSMGLCTPLAHDTIEEWDIAADPKKSLPQDVTVLRIDSEQLPYRQAEKAGPEDEHPLRCWLDVGKSKTWRRSDICFFVALTKRSLKRNWIIYDFFLGGLLKQVLVPKSPFGTFWEEVQNPLKHLSYTPAIFFLGGVEGLLGIVKENTTVVTDWFLLQEESK